MSHPGEDPKPSQAGSESPRITTTDPSKEAEVLEEVRKAIRGIEFGSVLIKIHEGEVVGIETSTKVRLKSGRGKDQPSG